MRTTLTLDPDVAAMLAVYRERHGVGLKQAVNDALRRGLPEPPERTRDRPPFETAAVDHGRALVPAVDDIGELLEALDDDPSR